jgi:hypothetical protein
LHKAYDVIVYGRRAVEHVKLVTRGKIPKNNCIVRATTGKPKIILFLAKGRDKKVCLSPADDLSIKMD